MSNRREELILAIQGIAGGDRSAMRTVYDMTSAKLLGTILRIIPARERAEDVLQDTFIKIWHRAGSFDPTLGSPITWLCTVARNTALNAVRSEGRRSEDARDELPEIADDGVTPADDWLCEMEDAAALSRCMEQLQDDQRRSIRLAYFEGLTHTELAERVDVPLGTMKSWIRRGLAGLRGCLGG